MKTKFITLSMIALLAITTISCSKSDPDPVVVVPPTGNIINTNDLMILAIDTAKVNKMTMTGTNETTILNRKQNLNSYISALSINADASKFVYADNQGVASGGAFVPTKTIRVANINGSNDALIYSVPAPSTNSSTQVGFVKFGPSKIYFATNTQTFVGGAVGNLTKLNSCNLDGSGFVDENYTGSALSISNSDVTTDGRYLATFQSAPNTPKFVIFDRTGDNGAGSLAYQETLTTQVSTYNSGASFSYDNKFAYFAFAESQTLKVRIINMTTLTGETKTIATNFTTPNPSYSIRLSVASDNNRGVVTLVTYDNTPSKTYVFNLSAGSSTNFNNNDPYILDMEVF